ncbi:MAG: response regulator transcription factor [Planctomycetota bacterium]
MTLPPPPPAHGATTMATRLLLVEDHPVVRAGVHAWLEGSAFHVVAEAESAEEALSIAVDAAPEVMLVDVRLPQADGLQCVARLRELGVTAPAVVFSGYDNPTYAARASAVGVAGYLPKTSTREEVLEALQTAAEGKSCWSTAERRRLAGALAAPRLQDDIEAPLTHREVEVLGQLALGLTNKEIAQALGISYETVKEHVQHILRKIGVSDRTQAAVWAVRKQLA